MGRKEQGNNGPGMGGGHGNRHRRGSGPGEATNYGAAAADRAEPAVKTPICASGTTMDEATCPLCEQHCPLDNPSCPKGEAYAARSL